MDGVDRETETMVDWLIVWGVTQAAGFTFGTIMQDLAKESVKDYAKDFFKNSITSVLHLPEKDTQKEAYGKALKVFLEMFQQQLEMADLGDDKIKDYGRSLKVFVLNDAVKPILGDAFAVDCQIIDTFALAQSWQSLSLPELPPEFNWDKLGKFYLRRVKEIIKNSDKLTAIFSIQAKHEDTENLQEMAGVKKEYNLENYAKGLKNEYQHLKLECLDTTSYEQIKLWRMFVPQSVKRCKQFIPQLYEIPKEILGELLERGEITQAELELAEAGLEYKRREYFKEQSHSVLDIVSYFAYSKKVLLGDPGAGKSTLLQYLALNWAEKELGEREFSPLPLLIELRIYARDKEEKKCKDFLEFFHQGNLFCHLNQLSLHYKLKKGQIIVLFDGLDEVFDPKLRQEIVTDIKRFSIDYPKNQIIVTSRWLGYKAEELSHAGFEHFMLQDLDKDQIKNFIQRWHDLAFQNREDKSVKQKRLQKAITESKAIRELAGNPLLLTMMAVLNRTQELPRDRPKLYERASEVLLHQWDFETKEGLTEPELKKYLYNIDLRDKKEILRSVANGMQAGEKGLAANLIYREDLESILAKYLEDTGIPKRDASDLSDLIIQQLRYRNFVLCSLGGNAFAFVHRTFLEYFCASEFYERFKKRGLVGGITLEGLKKEVFGKHFSDSSWREVLCLLIGMLSAEFPKEISDELINNLIDQDNDKDEFSNIFLAADCFAELRNRSAHPEISQRLLGKLEALYGKGIEYYYHEKGGDETWWQERDRVKEKIVISIARNWQDDPNSWNTLQNFAQSAVSEAEQELIIQALVKIAQLYPEALVKIKELAQKGKSKAIEILAQHWQDDLQTLSIIQQQAAKGESFAIETLVQYWQDDPQTLSIIQQQAAKGESFAIETLVQYWRNDPQILPIIKQQAKAGNSQAIEVLLRNWYKDLWALPIIKQQAQIGNSEAIKVLAEYWYDDPQALAIIQQKAEKGELIGIATLLKYWNNDHQVVFFIENLTRHEGNVEIFFEALETVEDYSIDQELKTTIEELLNNSDFPSYLSKRYKSLLDKKFQIIHGHFSTLRTKITDPELLIETLRDLGIPIKREGDVRGFNGQRARADVVAVLDGDYDLGWSMNSDGSMDLIADFWGVAKKHNQTQLINSIYQKYAVNQTLKKAKERGSNPIPFVR